MWKYKNMFLEIVCVSLITQQILTTIIPLFHFSHHHHPGGLLESLEWMCASAVHEIVISVAVISAGDMNHCPVFSPHPTQHQAADNHRTPTLSLTGFNSRLATKLLANRVSYWFLNDLNFLIFIDNKEQCQHITHSMHWMLKQFHNIMMIYATLLPLSPVPLQEMRSSLPVPAAGRGWLVSAEPGWASSADCQCSLAHRSHHIRYRVRDQWQWQLPGSSRGGYPGDRGV